MDKALLYKKWMVRLSWKKYANGRPMLTLLDVADGCPVSIATVNLPDEDLSPGEIIIKNYSENEGMLHFLQKNGIVSQPRRWVATGYVTCPVVEVL